MQCGWCMSCGWNFSSHRKFSLGRPPRAPSHIRLFRIHCAARCFPRAEHPLLSSARRRALLPSRRTLPAVPPVAHRRALLPALVTSITPCSLPPRRLGLVALGLVALGRAKLSQRGCPQQASASILSSRSLPPAIPSTPCGFPRVASRVRLTTQVSVCDSPRCLRSAPRPRLRARSPPLLRPLAFLQGCEGLL